MSDIITNLEDLSPDDLKAVSNLINKLAKRQRKNSEPKVDEVPPEPVNIIQDEPSQKPQRATTRRSKRPDKKPPQKAQSNQRVRRRGQQSRGGAGRTEPVSLSGENKFESMREKSSYREDSKTDKLLWGNHEPTERPDDFSFVEVECEICHKNCKVHPSLVYLDQDTRQPKYTCDSCVPRGSE